jgi:hypothetical protein
MNMKTRIVFALTLVVFVWGCDEKPPAPLKPVNGVASNESGGYGRLSPKPGISEDELGVRFYPGSSESKEGTLKILADKGNNLASVRTTKDDPAKVSDFYKGKIMASIATDVSDATTKKWLITGDSSNGDDVSVYAVKKPGQDTEITVTVSTPIRTKK